MPNQLTESIRVEMLELSYLHCLTVWIMLCLETDDLRFISLRLKVYMCCLIYLKMQMSVFKDWFFQASVQFCKMEKFSNTLLSGILRRRQLMRLNYWSNFTVKMTRDLVSITKMGSFKTCKDPYSLRLHMKYENRTILKWSVTNNPIRVRISSRLSIHRDLQCHRQVLCQKALND